MLDGPNRIRSSSSRIQTGLIQRLAQLARHFSPLLAMFVSLICLALLLLTAACHDDTDPQRVRPRQLRDVPARALAFNFQADVEPPAGLTSEEAKAVAAIQQDFDTRRKDDALLRTVVSPDGQRALALYGTTDEPSQTFRIDLYSADGNFLRNLTPPDLAVVFQDSVAWSADSGMIAFIGRKSSKPEPSPTPLPEEEPVLPSASPIPTASIQPAFAPLAVFNTEQVYLCNRDGYDLKPLTTRDGLIYFALSWAPDNHALVALACRENEWERREQEFKTPAGRPRLISPDGQERLLDDELAEAPPVWSPDSSKVATAFGVDIGIYDAAGKSPTQARIALRERLLASSTAFDEKSQAGKATPNSPSNKPGGTQPQATTEITLPFSFNPIVRLEWPAPDKLYVETAYISLRSELIKTFSRWHLLMLSPQAAVLGR
jgi:hypothetical protein